MSADIFSEKMKRKMSLTIYFRAWRMSQALGRHHRSWSAHQSQGRRSGKRRRRRSQRRRKQNNQVEGKDEKARKKFSGGFERACDGHQLKVRAVGKEGALILI